MILFIYEKIRLISGLNFNIFIFKSPVVCINCEVEWGEWLPCHGGTRIQRQYVSVHPVGAGSHCPKDLQEMTEGKPQTDVKGVELNDF